MKRLAVMLALALPALLAYRVAPSSVDPNPALSALQNGFDAVERCRPDVWASIHGRGLPVAAAISAMALELGVGLGDDRRVTTAMGRIAEAACG